MKRLLLTLALAAAATLTYAATADYDIADQTGASFLTDINGQLDAIQTNNSSATEPPALAQNMWWIDTGPVTPLWKMRNTANTDWLTFGEIGASAVTWTGALDVASGEIDGVTIGATTPATAVFTTAQGTSFLAQSAVPNLRLWDTSAAAASKQVRFQYDAGNFDISTVDSSDVVTAVDMRATVATTGVTEWSYRIEGTERLEVTSSGIDVIGVSQSDGFSTSSSSTMGDLFPASSNTYDLGASTANVWRTIRLQNSPVVVSDERTKSDISAIAEAECRAVGAIEVKRFRKIEGDGRWHFGPIAQEVIAAFAAEGLDAEDYALLQGDPDRWAVAYDELQWLKAACQ